MFIKTILKTDKKTKKRYYYYRLCESYRIADKPRHRTILNIGRLQELPNKEDQKLLADRIEEIIQGEEPILPSGNPIIDKLSHQYAGAVINQKLVDIPYDKGSKVVENLYKQADYQKVNTLILHKKEEKSS
jgi:hypothetical protein